MGIHVHLLTDIGGHAWPLWAKQLGEALPLFSRRHPARVLKSYRESIGSPRKGGMSLTRSFATTGSSEGKRSMFVFARHQNKRVVTAAGRHLLALIIVAIAIANVITGLVEVPWDTLVLLQPFFDLGGDALGTE